MKAEQIGSVALCWQSKSVAIRTQTGGATRPKYIRTLARFALGKYLRFLAGFSETPVNQISPGFANAASQYVIKNPSLFPGVNPANLSSNAYGAFDGIQTTSTAPMAGAAATSTIYYPGAVTETHYRGGFMVGVSMPINIYNLFGGNNKTSGSNNSGQ